MTCESEPKQMHGLSTNTLQYRVAVIWSFLFIVGFEYSAIISIHCVLKLEQSEHGGDY